MKKLVFATNNPHKLEEIRSILSGKYDVLSLKDIGCHDEIPEDFHTLEENARAKSYFVKEKYGLNCFADDTGLEVDYLEGKPGVYSARYAGSMNNAQANLAKLMKEMDGVENRKARFRTVISLILNNVEYQFEGIVNGSIAQIHTGDTGFGYDPVFIPEGHLLTFAQMTMDRKNTMSHRSQAIRKLLDFLDVVAE